MNKRLNENKKIAHAKLEATKEYEKEKEKNELRVGSKYEGRVVGYGNLGDLVIYSHGYTVFARFRGQRPEIDSVVNFKVNGIRQEAWKKHADADIIDEYEVHATRALIFVGGSEAISV